MAKEKKAPRPKAQTPKGFRDYFGSEVTERAEMLHAIDGVVRVVGVAGYPVTSRRRARGR